MEVKRLLDTNIVLYLLGGRLAEPLKTGVYYLSFVTEMELLSYPSLSSAELDQLTGFLAEINVVDIDLEIKEAAIRLRRKHGLRLPDAIIAATALVLEAELVTNDKKLSKIPGLHVKRAKVTES